MTLTWSMLSRQSAAAVKNIFWCFLNQTSWFNLFFLENLFPSYVHLTQFMHLSGIYQAQTSSKPHLLKGEQLLWCHGVSSCNTGYLRLPERKASLWQGTSMLAIYGPSCSSIQVRADKLSHVKHHVKEMGACVKHPARKWGIWLPQSLPINTPRQQRELHPVG